MIRTSLGVLNTAVGSIDTSVMSLAVTTVWVIGLVLAVVLVTILWGRWLESGLWKEEWDTREEQEAVRVTEDEEEQDDNSSYKG